MWTLAFHPRIPKKVREKVSKWGTCKDEYEGGDGWQSQLYIRESRRMEGSYVMTQKNCERIEVVNDPIGMGLDFGVVGFSEFGYLTKFSTYTNQEHLYGFQLDKEFNFKDFDYELSIGYLHGLTNASSDHVFLWNMEIEL